MCGICGAIGAELTSRGEALLRPMLAAIVHRGPDQEGLLVAPRFAAGTRRLSIIDLPQGNQPLWNESGTLAVFFNGEIYNFRALRQELESSGHQFRTHSDTEVIVHAYEAWGEGCLERLRGMFAFAVVEMPRGRMESPERIFIARDPLGIKPLYYTAVDGLFLFASEVRALLASGSVPRKISRDALASYLMFGSVCEPMTLVDGVMSLPPGHCMTISLDGPVRVGEPKAYWDIGRRISSLAGESPKPRVSPASQIRAILEDSVHAHLVADVPVGVFLSSGLDSTSLATLASGMQPGIQTFTVAFPDTEFSEAAAARRTALRLGTNHSELTLSDHEMVARLDEAVSAFDQPSMDGINTYFVSWAARQAGLKVALSGLGSDELFGGYSSFRHTARVARVASLARMVPGALRRFVADQVIGRNPFNLSPDAARKGMAAWLNPSALPHPYFFTRTLFTPQIAAAWLHDQEGGDSEAPWALWMRSSVEFTKSMDDFTAVSWLELRSYLANTLLRDTDAMSMHHSLEVRVPFLDTSLVECMLLLPESQKRSSDRPKELLIQALGERLPADVVEQKKRTFTFPWEKWLHGPLGDRVTLALAEWPPALEQMLSGNVVRGVLHDFRAGKTSWSRLWSLYVLGEWVKRNLDAGEPESGARARIAAVSTR
jgi:asparagine synthase (glutamine-hydrolysing)